VCFVRLRSEHRLKCATRIIMNLLHELGSRIHMQRDRFRQSAYGDTRMGFGIGRGGTILRQLTSTIMCSPEASTNPETSNALAAYEPLPATREGLCGISAPILLKSLGGETTSHSGLPNGCGLVVKYWFAGGLQNQFARCGSRADMSVPLRECLLMTQSRHE